MWQSDNKEVKNKLNEQLAKEQAKAEAQQAQRGKKRRAEEGSSNSSQPDKAARTSKPNRREGKS